MVKQRKLGPKPVAIGDLRLWHGSVRVMKERFITLARSQCYVRSRLLFFSRLFSRIVSIIVNEHFGVYSYTRQVRNCALCVISSPTIPRAVPLLCPVHR